MKGSSPRYFNAICYSEKIKIKPKTLQLIGIYGKKKPHFLSFKSP
jgi:hypothetical protein